MDLTQADDLDINESVHAFEAAVGATHQELERPSVQRVLVAIDGSNQDRTVLDVAGVVAERHAAQLVPVYAYRGDGDEVRDEYLRTVAGRLEEAGHLVALPPERAADVHESEPFEQILGIQKRGRCDLVVLDAPYLEDFGSLGDDSVGSTLDALMARSPVPLLVVREAKDAAAECFDEIVMPVALYPEDQVIGANWALDLVSERGSLRIVAVADRAMIAAAGEALEAAVDLDAVDDEHLAGLHRPRTAGLIAAMQREASARSLTCRVSVRAGDPVAVTAALANERDLVLVVSCPRDSTTSAFQVVQALARASRNPLLIV